MSDHEEDADPDGTGGGPEAGYRWTDAEQRERLTPEAHRLHVAILDDFEEEDLETLDLEGADDYILWAAVQALDEVDRTDRAIDLLRRILASVEHHPALDYPAIRLRLADHLRDRGVYDLALREVDRAESEDRELVDACRERRAEILVLMGRRAEGIRLFERVARRDSGDPWVPLRAAWAFLQRGDLEDARDWAGRADRVRRDAEDEAVARDAALEIDRLREEIEARARRRAVAGEGGSGAPLAAERDRILADLDAEETGLVQAPPRDDVALEAACHRLAGLHARASAGWDDAVEAGDETLIAAFDDLQWEIVGLAQRFGVSIPGTDDD